MANRKRNIQMKFYVTEEEKRLIDEKMAQLPTRRYGAYLRKMAIDGYIIQLDTTDIKRMNAALSAIGRNINQIAKRVRLSQPVNRPAYRPLSCAMSPKCTVFKLVQSDRISLPSAIAL